MTPEETTTKTATRYHIFRQIDNAGAKNYEPVDANVEALSAAAAIKKTATENGVYVAIQTRSFTPVKVKLEQTTTVTLT